MISWPDFSQKQIILAFLSRNEKLSFQNDNIIIRDDEKKIKHQSTLYKLFTLFVVGHCNITSGLLQKTEKFNFNLILMGHNLNTYATFNSKTEGNIILRKKQYEYKGTEIATYIVKNKISSQIDTLKHIRKKSIKQKQAIANLEKYFTRLSSTANNPKTLLGIEGIASRVYFNALFQEYNWQGRKPRTKHDPTNTLLDIGYTLLFNFVEGLLNQYGFELYQGVYHTAFYQRKSLVCDLVEPFRPIIDTKIYKSYRLNQINTDDFDIIQGQYRIYGKKAEPYLQDFIKELLKYKKPIFQYVQQYYRAFIAEKDIEEYPVFKKES